MRGKASVKKSVAADELTQKKKPGRPPMTEAEKKAAAKARAAERKKADNLKPELILQYQGSEIDMSALIESARTDFHSKRKRTLITAIKLYVKPEEHMAYYVINENHEGKIPF